jgi:hypothetical protein
MESQQGGKWPPRVRQHSDQPGAAKHILLSHESGNGTVV